MPGLAILCRDQGREQRALRRRSGGGEATKSWQATVKEAGMCDSVPRASDTGLFLISPSLCNI
jgi:hypothetical protein